MDSLPPKSVWRNMLEHGARGDGIRRPWMDEMRSQGIKLAVLTFEFDWTHGGEGLGNLRSWRLASAGYFVEYDNWGSRPIADARRLAAIRAAGLEAALEPVALARAKTGFWAEDPGHQHPPHETGTGYKRVFLAENEWLPVQMFPWFGQYEPGTTTLMHAATLGDVRRIGILLSQGADVNAVSPSGSTALVYAASSGNALAVETLLKAGASVNTDAGGEALITAAAAGNARSVELLLKAGADRNFRDKDGATPLSVAERHGYAAIVDLLKQARAH